MSEILYKQEIPQELSNYIQTLELEKSARENLILTIITAGIDPTVGNAKMYFDEYIEFAIKANLAKEELQYMYIPAGIMNKNTEWSLDYRTNIITVEPKSGGCTNGCHR